MKINVPSVVIAALVAATVALLASCRQSGAEAKPADVDYYTCTMHPSVRSQDPHGKCPVCGMDLVPVKKATGAANLSPSEAGAKAEDEPPHEFAVPVERQQQIGVTYAEVKTRPLQKTLRAFGAVAHDKRKDREDAADRRVVRIWAQFSQDELPMLKTKLPVRIAASAYPSEQFSGKISGVDGFVDDATRSCRVGIDVNNPDLSLRPGMSVEVELSIDMGKALAVPVGAVLPTGLHNITFVDKGGGRLEPRDVELGRKYGDYYEVKSGLKENERVVSSANFLIDAEAQVQGALKSW